MSSYRFYNDLLLKSVYHIFSSMIGETLEPILDSPQDKNMIQVSVDMRGSLYGELIFRFPLKTVKHILDIMGTKDSLQKSRANLEDTASEISNMIAGTFVNYLQYAKHDVEVDPPEIIEGNEKYVRTLYENVAIPLSGNCGVFEVELYYKETRKDKK